MDSRESSTSPTLDELARFNQETIALPYMRRKSLVRILSHTVANALNAQFGYLKLGFKEFPSDDTRAALKKAATGYSAIDKLLEVSLKEPVQDTESQILDQDDLFKLHMASSPNVYDSVLNGEGEEAKSRIVASLADIRNAYIAKFSDVQGLSPDERSRLEIQDRDATGQRLKEYTKEGDGVCIVLKEFANYAGEISRTCRQNNQLISHDFGKMIEKSCRNLHVCAQVNANFLRMQNLDARDELVDPDRIWETVRDFFPMEAQAGQIKFNREVKNRLFTADRVMVNNIVLSLVANALKWTDSPNSPVKVSVSSGDGNVKVSVQDSGRGMTAKMLEDFQPLLAGYQDKPAALEKMLGTGFYTAGILARGMGGRLEAASPGKGNGSIVTLVLPDRLAQSRKAMKEELEKEGCFVYQPPTVQLPKDLVLPPVIRNHQDDVRIAVSNLADFLGRPVVIDRFDSDNVRREEWRRQMESKWGSAFLNLYQRGKLRRQSLASALGTLDFLIQPSSRGGVGLDEVILGISQRSLQHIFYDLKKPKERAEDEKVFWLDDVADWYASCDDDLKLSIVAEVEDLVRKVLGRLAPDFSLPAAPDRHSLLTAAQQIKRAYFLRSDKTPPD